MILKKNNKGSTIVLVLVVMAFVGMFAAVALWISLNNFQMKITNQNVTDSFYSAEAILDQIRAGLQNEVSTAYSDAYEDLLKIYTSYQSEDSSREQYFATKFVEYLERALQYNDGTNSEKNSCKLSLLQGYVSSGVIGTYTVYSADGNPSYCRTSIAYDESTNNVTGLAINDICVDYTDPDGYLSRVQTDILIQIPSLKISSVASPPSIADFCLIGNNGVSLDTTLGLSIIGSMYAGPYIGLSAKYSSVTFSVPELQSTGNDYVVVDGNVSLSGKVTDEKNLVTKEGVQLWTNDITVDTSVANLFGNTYVADDLILSGTNPVVSFYNEDATVNSLYYGFGNDSNNSEKSSSVVLNGTGCELNLNGLSSMTLCGYSFVGTGKITYYTDVITGDSTSTNQEDLARGQTDLLMGESIAVKGDQIAYLVPSECIGVSISSPTVGTSSYHNPMTYKEYNALKSETEGDKATKYWVGDAVTVNKVGKPLYSYTNGKDINDCFQTIFVPNGDGLVYFYLKLDGSAAEQYFKDYYSADTTKLLKYTDFYTKAIQCKNASIITAPGTTLTYSESEDGSKSVDYHRGTSSADSSKYSTMYEALCSTLCTDSSKYSVIKDTVFSTIVADERDAADADAVALTEFLQGEVGKKIAMNFGNSRVVLIDGDYTLGDGAGTGDDGADDFTKNTLIICTGDVTITSRTGYTMSGFTGSIIAKGKIEISDAPMNFVIQPMDESVWRNLLTQKITNSSSKQATIAEFFREGSAYLSESGVDAGVGNSLSDLIVYQNWKKK
jgi:hypothetical protein